VVRGPAALLAASALALTYFLVAGELPDLGSGDGAVLVAGVAGVGCVAAVVLSLSWAGEETVPLGLLFAGSFMLVAGLDAAGATAGVSPFEALAAGSFGILLGRALAAPTVAFAIPVFVAVVDAWSVATGPSSTLEESSGRGAAELTFDLPAWGGAPGASSRLGLVDAIFLAMFSVWAARYGLRRRATAIGMAAGMLSAVVLSVALDRAVPALPLIAVGYWVPNIDRFGDLLQREQGE
jgi:hypothetical protein